MHLYVLIPLMPFNLKFWKWKVDFENLVNTHKQLSIVTSSRSIRETFLFHVSWAKLSLSSLSVPEQFVITDVSFSSSQCLKCGNICKTTENVYELEKIDQIYNECCFQVIKEVVRCESFLIAVFLGSKHICLSNLNKRSQKLQQIDGQTSLDWWRIWFLIDWYNKR